MNCQEFEERLELSFISGETLDEHAQKHLDECRECKELLTVDQDIDQLLAIDQTELHSSIMEKVNQTKRYNHSRIWFKAVAALLIVSIGVVGLLTNSSKPDNQIDLENPLTTTMGPAIESVQNMIEPFEVEDETKSLIEDLEKISDIFS